MKMRIAALLAALAALLGSGQVAFAQTATVTATPTVTVTATKTVTPTPTVTATPTVTPTPDKVPRIQKHLEREGSESAMDSTAPRFTTLLVGTGNLVDNAVYSVMAANGFRIRGASASLAVVGSEATITIKVNARVIATFNLVGKAGKANYKLARGAPVIVNPGDVVSVLTESTGTNTGPNIQIDTIP